MVEQASIGYWYFSKCSFSFKAGLTPITVPSASFAPLAAARGKPIVAPKKKIALFSAIVFPTAVAFSSSSLEC